MTEIEGNTTMNNLRHTCRFALAATFTAATVMLVVGACTPAEEQATNEIDALEEAASNVADEAADRSAEVEEAATAAREFVYAEQDEFQTWASEEMKTTGTELEALEARIAELDDDAKAEWQTVREELEQSRQAAETKVKEAMNAGEEMWQTASAEAAEAVEDLRETVSNALRELSTTDEPSS